MAAKKIFEKSRNFGSGNCLKIIRALKIGGVLCTYFVHWMTSFSAQDDVIPCTEYV